MGSKSSAPTAPGPGRREPREPEAGVAASPSGSARGMRGPGRVGPIGETSECAEMPGKGSPLPDPPGQDPGSLSLREASGARGREHRGQSRAHRRVLARQLRGVGEGDAGRRLGVPGR